MKVYQCDVCGKIERVGIVNYLGEDLCTECYDLVLQVNRILQNIFETVISGKEADKDEYNRNDLSNGKV